jgi:hypothetical protein
MKVVVSLFHGNYRDHYRRISSEAGYLVDKVWTVKLGDKMIGAVLKVPEYLSEEDIEQGGGFEGTFVNDKGEWESCGGWEPSLKEAVKEVISQMSYDLEIEE